MSMQLRDEKNFYKILLQVIVITDYCISKLTKSVI